MQGIYKITNKANGKCYIGQSIDIVKRWKEHVSSSFNQNKKCYNYPLYRAIRKYREDGFIFDTLEIVGCKNDLTVRELYYYYLLNPEYNQVIPESGGISNSKPIYAINLKTLRTEFEFSSIAEAGRSLSVDSATIWGAANGKYITAYGYYWCTKDNYSDNWKPRERDVPYKKRKVHQINPITLKIIKTYESIKEAGGFVGTKSYNISAVLSGRSKSCKGYFWRYADGY